MAPNERPPRRRSTGRVTLTEVADAAGVSPITASRALRSDRNVAPELVERVKTAARRLAYVPDTAAQSLASSRSRNVVVLVPLLSNRVFASLLEAAQATLLDAGYQALFGVTHYDAAEEERLLNSFIATRPAGLLLTGTDHTPGTRRLLKNPGVPHVHLMELTTARSGYSVGFSQQRAGEAVARHLLARGRRRIAYVATQLDPRVMQRAAGCRASLEAAGRHDPALELLDPRPSSVALGGELFTHLLDRAPDVDAVFFCNDDLAQGALLAALRLGIDVPKQVAVVGFNDLEGSDQMLPSLTSVRTPRDSIGAAGAALLLRLIRGEAVAEKSMDLGFELVVRGSS